MKVGALFTGAGGFDMGFEAAGFEIAWQVEIDPDGKELTDTQRYRLIGNGVVASVAYWLASRLKGVVTADT